jgi:hypothetical protein
MLPLPRHSFTCSFCRVNYGGSLNPGNRPTRLDGCQHTFCYNCTNVWLGSGNNAANSCPVCSRQLYQGGREERTEIETSFSWSVERRRSSTVSHFHGAIREALPTGSRSDWIIDTTDNEEEPITNPRRSSTRSNRSTHPSQSGSNRPEQRSGSYNQSHNPNSNLTRFQRLGIHVDVSTGQRQRTTIASTFTYTPAPGPPPPLYPTQAPSETRPPVPPFLAHLPPFADDTSVPWAREMNEEEEVESDW